MATRSIDPKKQRFLVVGAVNTALDFGLLIGLTGLGLASIPANFISTAVAFLFSFSANRRYTFQATSGHVGKQITLFIVVTFFGLWAIQPVIILLVEPQIISLGSSEWIALITAKLLATIVTMVWNFVLYSRVVFKTKV